MTASQKIKGLLAGAATVTLIGTAIAQGTPPDPSVRSAPVGAGQQSSQQTPMGTTGTPAGGAAASSGSTAAGSSGSGTMGSTAPSADTSVASSAPSGRRARADRN